jgi:ribose 5-phosphate isomerase A
MSEKQIAAEKATQFLNDGMIIGLGSGSTVYFFLKKLGDLIKKGLKVTGVSTSNSTTSIALSYNIPLILIDEVDKIDLTIDGADEIDEQFNGIKGGGGAILFEKIVASISEKIIWVVDSAKLVNTLGAFPLPVEVISFGYIQTLKKFERDGYNPSLRMKNGMVFQSDGNNYIIDLNLGKIEKPARFAQQIKSYTGVIESGLFLNTPDKVIVGYNDEVKVLENKSKIKKGL